MQSFVSTAITKIKQYNSVNILWCTCQWRRMRQKEIQHILQAESSVIKPAQAARDERGRVNLDDLTDTDLDYGCDEKSLASLRRRLKKAINTYDGEPQYHRKFCKPLPATVPAKVILGTCDCHVHLSQLLEM